MVFLTKKYPKESERYLQMEEFNFIDSIYAIIDTIATKDNFNQNAGKTRGFKNIKAIIRASWTGLPVAGQAML